jgi:hypothetical protein
LGQINAPLASRAVERLSPVNENYLKHNIF